MENLNNNDEKIIEVIQEKLNTVLDKMEYDVNSDFIFYNERIYFQVKYLLNEIDELWGKIKTHSDITYKIYLTLNTEVEEIFEANKKYYEDRSDE